MARKGKAKPSREERPPPLPPETRTVGQLVAESIRLYGRRFWPSLALGIGPAAVGAASSYLPRTPAIVVLSAAGALVMGASYTGASVIVSERRPNRRILLTAIGLGFLVYLPVPYLTLLLVLPAVFWLAFVGLSVPALVIEDLDLRSAVRRGVALARADFVHAAGSLATLVIVVFLTGSVMSILVHGGSGQAVRITAFLASLVVTPLLFLGAALLYYDQAARLPGRRPSRPAEPASGDA
jgi:MFS family permease